jgi:hemolysin D
MFGRKREERAVEREGEAAAPDPAAHSVPGAARLARGTHAMVRSGRLPQGTSLEAISSAQAVMAIPAKFVARHTLSVIGLLLLIVAIIFCTVNMDRTVTAGGKLVSMVNPLVVAPFNNGIVRTIAVSEGDIVRKGQLLAQLDPTYAQADDRAAREQVDRYQTEIDRLTAELHQTPYRPALLTPGALIQEGMFAQRAAARASEIRYYQGQIDAERALVRQAEIQVRQYAKETGIAFDVEKIREVLERAQIGSRFDTLSAQSARLDLERQVLVNVQQIQNAQATVNSLQGQLDNYNQQWFADISQKITDDAVQLANYRGQLEHSALNVRLMDLRAEEDAMVLSVAKVSVGSVMMAGQTFFELVPVNAPLEVDAQVLGDQAGFVRPGQRTSIKFATFPYHHFGMGHGVVRLISADSYLTSSSAANMSVTNQQGTTTGSAQTASDGVFTGQLATSPYYYDVRVTLDRVQLRGAPPDFHPVPGMPVQADMIVGNRTILDYIKEKLVPVFTEGWREAS